MKSGNKPAVTIYEIAQHVGVSPAAVSSTLSNRHVERRIAAETVDKIKEAAAKLGYVPNLAGRRLRAHKTATRQYDLAILTSFEAPLPLVGQVLQSLQQAVDAHSDEHTRFAVAIEMFHAGRLAEKPGILEANRYHAAIITNTLPKDDEFLAETRLPYPAIVLGRRIPGYRCILEAPDFVGRRSAKILAEAGCKKPALLHGRLLTHTTADRVAAFRQAIRELLGREPETIVSDGLLPDQAVSALEAYLKHGYRFDGLFAVTDSLAMGAYRTLKKHGWKIPREVAVVGVGDYGQAEFFDPPLTTVAGSNDAMVAEAIPLLFKLLRRPEVPAREIHVMPSVLERESTRRRKA